MAVTDPIGDMLTRIRNALIVGHDSVMIPSSNMKVSLATILKNEGFVEDFEVSEGSTPQGVIKVSLHYGENDEPGINGLKRVSRPGLRVYVQRRDTAILRRPRSRHPVYLPGRHDREAGVARRYRRGASMLRVVRGPACPG
jgi:small subunit ribosomal protein S8